MPPSSEIESIVRPMAGTLNRRQMLSLGLRLGLATPVIAGLMSDAPEANAAAQEATPSTEAAQSSGTFTVLGTGAMPTLDPHVAYDNQASMLFLGAYEMLLRLKGESTSEFAAMLAESWETSEDQSTYTFHIAPNALFHDGTPCDAQAVKDSFTRFLEMGQGPVNVIARFVSDPNQMEVVDPATIQFNLERPEPLFLAAMASEYGPLVVNAKLVEEHKTDDDPFASEWFSQNMVGTGPYRMTENEPNSHVTLEWFDGYHGGWAGNHFDHIVMRIVEEGATRRQLLESGEADAATYSLTPEDVTALQDNPDLQVLIYASTAVGWTHMNAPRLKTPEVRQGFSYAFPYDAVKDSVYQGLLERSGPIPDSVRGYDPEVFIYPTDLTKAKELIQGAGFQEGDVFDYVYPAGEQSEATVAQLFQANVAEMGFTLEVSEVDRATHGDYLYGSAPAEERPMFIAAQRWWPDYNDPWNMLAPNFTEAMIGNGGNASAWVNERFEQIMAEAEHYTDEEQLASLMKEAQNILTEQDPPAIYYGQLKWYTVLRADIQGFVPNPLYLSSYPFYEMSRTT
jgi:peptide/nickel transport system substrate-binding protein